MQNTSRLAVDGSSRQHPANTITSSRDLSGGVLEALWTVSSSGTTWTCSTPERHVTSQNDVDADGSAQTVDDQGSGSTRRQHTVDTVNLSRTSNEKNEPETSLDDVTCTCQTLSLPEAKVELDKQVMLADQVVELLEKSQEMTAWLCRHREQLHKRKHRREKRKTEGEDDETMVRQLHKSCRKIGKEIDSCYHALGAFVDLQRDILCTMTLLCDKGTNSGDVSEEDEFDSSSCTFTSDSEVSESSVRYSKCNKTESLISHVALHADPVAGDREIGSRRTSKLLSLAERKYHSFLKSKRTKIEDDNRLENVSPCNQTAAQGRNQNMPIANSNVATIEIANEEEVTSGKQTGYSTGVSRTVTAFTHTGIQHIGELKESEHSRSTHAYPGKDRSTGNSSSHVASGGREESVLFLGQSRSESTSILEPRCREDVESLPDAQIEPCARSTSGGQRRPEDAQEKTTGRLGGTGYGQAQDGAIYEGDAKPEERFPDDQTLDIPFQRTQQATASLQSVEQNKWLELQKLEEILVVKRQYLHDLLKRELENKNQESDRRPQGMAAAPLRLQPTVSDHSTEEGRSADETGQNGQDGSSRLQHTASAGATKPEKTESTVMHDERAQPKKEAFVPAELWERLAKDAVDISKSMREDLPETGMYTVLCLDISDSMKGEPWSAMAGFVDRFLHHVEWASQKGHFERVAMVTFGHETRVLQYFTTDYQKLRKAFDNLYPDGPSPMYGGLSLAQGICRGGGSRRRHCRIILHPRVVMVTDGHPTVTGLIAGSDVLGDIDTFQCQTRIVHRVQHMRAHEHVKVSVVPVGDFDFAFLRRITVTTNGSLLTTEQEQTEMFMLDQNTRIAGVYLRNLNRRVMARADILFQNPELSTEDLGFVKKILKNVVEMVETKKDKEILDSNETIEGLPPVGSRVRRGPEWNPENNHDNGRPGTIIGHRHEGQVRVFWDSGVPSLHDYGYNGRYEVVVVDEPRQLDDNEDIAIGCFVKKGKDWDAAKIEDVPDRMGCVYKTTTFGFARVMWPSGKHGLYKYGYHGGYELEICSVEEYRANLTIEKAAPCQANKNAIIPLQTTLHSSAEAQSTAQGTTPCRPRPMSTTGIQAVVTEGSASDPLIIPYNTAQGGAPLRRTGRTFGTFASRLSQTDSTLHSSSGVAAEASASVVSGMDSVDLCNARNASDVTAIKDLSFIWQYKDVTGKWITHTSDVCRAVETAFQSKPPATCLVYINDQPFRVMTSTMKQIHLQTGTVCDIQRVTN